MSVEEGSNIDTGAVSNFRGIGFGCLYMIASWIAVGVMTAVLLPAVLPGPKWNHGAIGAIVSILSIVLIAVPLGIYGFLRHRNKT